VQGDDEMKANLEHQTPRSHRTVQQNDERRIRRSPLAKTSEVVDLTSDSADQEIQICKSPPKKARRSEIVDLTSDSANQDEPTLIEVDRDVLDIAPRNTVDLTSDCKNHNQDEPTLMEVDTDDFDVTTCNPAETVEQFLKRMPVSDRRCAQEGPWLWIHAPDQRLQKEAQVCEFTQAGVELLRGYNDQRDEIEHQCRGKTKGIVTRKLKPYSEQLKTDILKLATALNTTCGKWMLFPGTNDVSHDWALVAKATADGKLGQTSKVATWDPSRSHVLICVYTPDFNDVAQIKRVLHSLIGLGLRSLTSRLIYYKCDAYTYLSIESDNPYKLKASLYSSRDLLDSAIQDSVKPPTKRQSREHSGWTF
jgi:hypothetical protein